MTIDLDAPALTLFSVSAGYKRVPVLRDVDLSLPRGTVVALLGPNGAGKTTLLRTAAGLLRPTAGTIRLHGKDVTAAPAHRRARAGLCLIPEGRGIFPKLSVRENLRMLVPPWGDVSREQAVQQAVEAFPVLGQRLGQTAGSLSGGQQQMLALSRSFLAAPDVVMLDEVSMGLAPKVVDEIFTFLRGIAARGTSVVLVEQYVQRALELADRVVLLSQGQVTYSGPAGDVAAADLMRDYLGV